MSDISRVRIGISDRSPFGDPPPISYGRTDGRTDEEGPSLVDYLNVANKGQANNPETPSLSETIETLAELWPTANGRWPVVRTGERERIPWGIRTAVKMRDNFCCRLCKRSAKESDLELDHIVPWSAGGPDKSDNLRTLCQPCNQERSNRFDNAHLGHVLPITFWCLRCWDGTLTDSQHADSFWLDYGETTHCVKFCGYEYAGPNWKAFNAMRFVEAAETRAYCAHCKTVGMTDVTL